MTILRDLAERQLPQILEDAIALIEVESPSHDLEAVARSAKWTSDLVHERLGVTPESIVTEGRTHLVTRFGDSPTRLMLLGHHDTVWPIGTLTRLPAAVTDGALRGPGGLDMKLGVVQAIHALSIVRKLHGDDALDGITLLVTGDEEIGSPRREPSSRNLPQARCSSSKPAATVANSRPSARECRCIGSMLPVAQRTPGWSRKRASTPQSNWLAS